MVELHWAFISFWKFKLFAILLYERVFIAVISEKFNKFDLSVPNFGRIDFEGIYIIHFVFQNPVVRIDQNFDFLNQ